jgi:alpha-D-xyloside xylohydrolase
VFEVGGAGLNATPWEYPTWTVNDFRQSVILHYELFPYFYALAEQGARTGVPILRSLGYQYPGDARAFAQDQEMMVGPDLLAAPVTVDRAQADGDAGRRTPVQVYLPRGSWINLFTGRAVSGGRTITDDVGLAEFPLYMRAGTAIGFNARTPDVWGTGWAPDALTEPRLAGWMYAPGGQATAISSSSGTLTAATAGHRISLVLRGAPQRDQILVLTRRTPGAVTEDRRPLSRAASVSALRRVAQGWVRTDAVPSGVLIKLRPGTRTTTLAMAFR